MEELTFQIQNKLTLRKHTQIRAICTQDKKIINIKVPNTHKDNVNYIKNALIKEHIKLVNQAQNNQLGIGSII